MSALILSLFLIAGSFAACWTGIRMLLPFLQRRALLDVPNERSNHTVPTPRGGGVAVIGAALLFLMAAKIPGAVFLSTLALALISWRDDTVGVSPAKRLTVQFIAVVFAWPALPFTPNAAWIALPVGVLLWMWFINLTNFMDGIDGISAAETISIALGILAVQLVHPELPVELALFGLIIASAMAAFWWFNRSPAQIFLGDVGSIPLGFLLGFLLLSMAAEGLWAAALILPAYYLADSGAILVQRARRGENLARAHSSHYYQQAVKGGMSHAKVVQHILGLNLLLIVLAGFSALGTLASLLSICMAYGLTAALLNRFRQARPIV